MGPLQEDSLGIYSRHLQTSPVRKPSTLLNHAEALEAIANAPLPTAVCFKKVLLYNEC